MKTFRCVYVLVLALACLGAQGAPLRDPFARPPAPAAAPAPAPDSEPAVEAAPVLRAVMFEPGHSMANISGHILAAGEWFGSYRVVRIDERSVTLQRGKVKSVLVLDREGSK